jgi:hypothetical protein
LGSVSFPLEIALKAPLSFTAQSRLIRVDKPPVDRTHENDTCKNRTEKDRAYKARRREPRFQPDTPVKVKVLGWPPGPTMSGQVLDVSGSGMRLQVPLPVACGVPVEIDASETVSLGEVCRCSPVNDHYEIGLQLSHTLSSLHGLDRATREQIEYEHKVWSRTRS